jgi:hypothetical protein
MPFVFKGSAGLSCSELRSICTAVCTASCLVPRGSERVRESAALDPSRRRYGRQMDDLDARRRLEPDVLEVLDAIFNVSNGLSAARLSSAQLAKYLGATEADVRPALRILMEDVRRIHGDEIGPDGAPMTFTTIYVPAGDAYASFVTIWEQRGAASNGAVPRHAMEQMQGYWPEIDAVDFDAGLADLESHGWAQAQHSSWSLTGRGISLGKSRLVLP